MRREDERVMIGIVTCQDCAAPSGNHYRGCPALTRSDAAEIAVMVTEGGPPADVPEPGYLHPPTDVAPGGYRGRPRDPATIRRR